jgi:hypothetical protein
VLRGAADQPKATELWDKIARRIDEEERAGIFLGRRVAEGSERAPRWFERVGFDRAAWGMTGGMLAASLTVFMLRQAPDASRDGLNFASTALPLTHIGMSAERPVPRVATTSSAPVSFSSATHNIVEVDWMRSDGRVRLLQDPSERSAIIWVKRRQLPHSIGAAPQHRADSNVSVTPSLQVPSFSGFESLR